MSAAKWPTASPRWPWWRPWPRPACSDFSARPDFRLTQVEQAVAELARRIGPGHAWGVNLIHSPQEPAQEEHLAELLIRAQVPCVSASAFMALTPALIRCAAAGLSRDAAGNIVRARQIFAKVSRMEVAERFMSPPPANALAALVARGALTPDEAALAAQLPIAEDVTVEADSGGHTDGRPLTVLLPGMLELRANIMARHPSFPRIRVGAAGGLGTPGAVAAAFALGADYVLTGSVNQAAVESGLSAAAKAMLGEADFADVAMAPAADMFELGVKVQVLKRGTLFAARATRLYEAWLRYDSLEAIPGELRARIEAEIFRKPLRAGVAGDARVLERTRSGRSRARRARAQAQDGAGLPLVSGHVQPLGDRRRTRAARRLPDLVRPGDGRLQPLGRRHVPRGPRAALGGADRAQPARRRRGPHARASASNLWRAGSAGRLPLRPPAS